ncbi:unnamed protein product, partial [Brassica oleracea]
RFYKNICTNRIVNILKICTFSLTVYILNQGGCIKSFSLAMKHT